MYLKKKYSLPWITSGIEKYLQGSWTMSKIMPSEFIRLDKFLVLISVENSFVIQIYCPVW